MPKATAVFDADDSRLGAALVRINSKMLALQSRIAGDNRSVPLSLICGRWDRSRIRGDAVLLPIAVLLLIRSGLGASCFQVR
jgi:hypothetical protein